MFDTKKSRTGAKTSAENLKVHADGAGPSFIVGIELNSSELCATPAQDADSGDGQTGGPPAALMNWAFISLIVVERMSALAGAYVTICIDVQP